MSARMADGERANDQPVRDAAARRKAGLTLFRHILAF